MSLYGVLFNYGVEVGQTYTRADGAPDYLVVIDIDDVVGDAHVQHYFENGAKDGEPRYIDLFKLARVRYVLKK